MLIIRLQRTGKKNQADFRIVLAEKEAPVNKKIVEILGSFNPRKKAFQAKEDRLKYWFGQKVSMSQTAHNLFVTKGLLDAKKVKAFTIPKKPVDAEAAPATASADAVSPPRAGGDTATETPVEVAEATAEVESKVQAQPVEIAAVEENQPVPETTTPEPPPV